MQASGGGSGRATKGAFPPGSTELPRFSPSESEAARLSVRNAVIEHVEKSGGSRYDGRIAKELAR